MKNKKPFNIDMFVTNRKHMIIAIVLGLVTTGLVLFAIIPQFQEFLSLRSELSKESPKLEKLKEKLVELQNIRFTPEFAQAEIVESALPSKKPLLELLTSLNTIAVSNDIKIENFDLSPGIIATNTAELQIDSTKKLSSDGVDTIEVSMDAIGAFGNVQQFLIDLEKISPFTTIATLSLNSVKNGDDFDNEELGMRAALITESHFFTQTVIASLEAPLPTLNTSELNVLQELQSFSVSGLPEQLKVKNGGLEDLFGIDPINFE